MAFRDQVEISTSSSRDPFKHAVWRDLEPSDDGAIVIRKDGIVLDIGGGGLSRGELEGSLLESPPDQFVGRGIVVRGAKNVTIRNMKISGFKVAIYAEDAPGLTVENCDVSCNYRQHLKSTSEKEDESDWLYGHENDNNEWLRYGAGIYLLRCDGATVKNCRARNGQNGICLVRCNDATVVGSDMSFMSGWGLAMWRSNRCKVIGNRFDYCVRGHSHGVYARGQDSAGILVYEQCSDNVFAYNHATHGGDGFFLYAGNETVNKTGEGGCNRNTVKFNDFSYAVANGIEATFSDRNVFACNKLNNCEHGIWAGYSSRSLIYNNCIRDSKNGISIEHGRMNSLQENVIARCKLGARFWWDEDPDLLESKFCKKGGCVSQDERLERNFFVRCSTGLLTQVTQGLRLVENRFDECDKNWECQGPSSVAEFKGNAMRGGVIENVSPTKIVGKANLASRTTQVVGPFDLLDPIPDDVEGWKRVRDPESLWASPFASQAFGDSIAATLGVSTPERMGTKPLGPLPGIPEGKEHIVITEWGPWDFTGLRPSRAATTRPADGH